MATAVLIAKIVFMINMALVVWLIAMYLASCVEELYDDEESFEEAGIDYSFLA